MLNSFFFLILQASLVVFVSSLPYQQNAALLAFGEELGFDFVSNSVGGDLCVQKQKELVKCFNNSVISINLPFTKGGIFPSKALFHLTDLQNLTLRNSFKVKGSVVLGVHLPYSLVNLDLLETNIANVELLNSAHLKTLAIGGVENISYVAPRLYNITMTRAKFYAFSLAYGPDLVHFSLFNSTAIRLEIKGVNSVLQHVYLEGSNIKQVMLDKANQNYGLSFVAKNCTISSFQAGNELVPNNVDLASSNLEVFTWKAPTKILKSIDVSNNRLKSVSVSFGILFDQVSHCDFSGNPFECPTDKQLMKYCKASCQSNKSF